VTLPERGKREEDTRARGRGREWEGGCQVTVRHSLTATAHHLVPLTQYNEKEEEREGVEWGQREARSTGEGSRGEGSSQNQKWTCGKKGGGGERREGH